MLYLEWNKYTVWGKFLTTHAKNDGATTDWLSICNTRGPCHQICCQTCNLEKFESNAKKVVIKCYFTTWVKIVTQPLALFIIVPGRQ